MPDLKLQDLSFDYPEDLVATSPSVHFRAMVVKGKTAEPTEIKSKSSLFDMFAPGDVLVINDTRVEKRRVFSTEGFEILFLNELEDHRWEVLMPWSRWTGDGFPTLPGAISIQKVENGMPQVLTLSESPTSEYFEQHGEMALPPYIQKARERRHQVDWDDGWYQPDWAENKGSSASPTASLHFRREDLRLLESRGIRVLPITLHVGLGTFAPIRTATISDHTLHEEVVTVRREIWDQIQEAKSNSHKVWALGTTVVRALESRALNGDEDTFKTNLFLKPGDHFRVVDCILTNFHQPQSSLICMIAAFAGLERVMKTYHWAIQKKFKLFSYGDLSVWMR